VGVSSFGSWILDQHKIRTSRSGASRVMNQQHRDQGWPWSVMDGHGRSALAAVRAAANTRLLTRCKLALDTSRGSKTPPIPKPCAPARSQSAYGSESAPSPPTGIHLEQQGAALLASRRIFGLHADAGNSFKAAAPPCNASTASRRVPTPGIYAAPAYFATSATPSSKLGLTRKRAPARRDASACSRRITVPAPTRSGTSFQP